MIFDRYLIVDSVVSRAHRNIVVQVHPPPPLPSSPTGNGSGKRLARRLAS